jgi:hypothetical protein
MYRQASTCGKPSSGLTRIGPSVSLCSPVREIGLLRRGRSLWDRRRRRPASGDRGSPRCPWRVARVVRAPVDHTHDRGGQWSGVRGRLRARRGVRLHRGCDTATVALSEVRRGLMAAGGGVLRLTRQLPTKIALEILLTGEPISATRAADLGLVNRVAALMASQDAREGARAFIEKRAPTWSGR